jgi:hypothetical protein
MNKLLQFAMLAFLALLILGGPHAQAQDDQGNQGNVGLPCTDYDYGGFVCFEDVGGSLGAWSVFYSCIFYDPFFCQGVDTVNETFLWVDQTDFPDGTYWESIWEYEIRGWEATYPWTDLGTADVYVYFYYPEEECN